MLSFPSISSPQVCALKLVFMNLFFSWFSSITFLWLNFFLINQNILWQKHYFYSHVLLQPCLSFFMSFSVLSTYSSVKENISSLSLSGAWREVGLFHILCLECPFWLCLENCYSPFRSSSDIASSLRPSGLKLATLFSLFPFLGPSLTGILQPQCNSLFS